MDPIPPTLEAGDHYGPSSYRSEDLPQRLTAPPAPSTTVQDRVASGARRVVGHAHGLSEHDAETRLREAAARAGAPLAQVVDTVIAGLGAR